MRLLAGWETYEPDQVTGAYCRVKPVEVEARQETWNGDARTAAQEGHRLAVRSSFDSALVPPSDVLQLP